MAHIEQLESLQKRRIKNDGDSTTKLEQEIVAMEMSLNILKRAATNHANEQENLKRSKGYIWKGARDTKSSQNYAEHVLDAHQRRMKKRRNKNKIKLDNCDREEKCASESIPKPLHVIDDFFAAENDVLDHDHRRDLTANVQTESSCVKKCCYHCYKLFVFDSDSQSAGHMDDDAEKYFCGEQCKVEYIQSVSVTCADPHCDAKFLRANGFRASGKWFCSRSAHSLL
eukprot:CAMPEP_0202704450 /NCGR_PEP_ID=MMETSP1385-20130828/17122_1 /ASSEMBLY_ACC=CAM_ASM_000861 /TAXON_ID=933848 /ORGANISM="Elphidium margaritaceum" /LENGTH=226 /DNA_ID=CAMNT_0049362475 /DNA_START=34 /DNA_END=714 /DNA_ORIENTATION=-